MYAQEGRISEDKADEFKGTILLPRLLLKITVIIQLCVSGRIRVAIYVTEFTKRGLIRAFNFLTLRICDSASIMIMIMIEIQGKGTACKPDRYIIRSNRIN